MGTVTLALGDAATGAHTETAMLKPGQAFGMERLAGGEGADSEVVLTATAVGTASLLWMRPSLYATFSSTVEIQRAVSSIVELTNERRQAAQLAKVGVISKMIRIIFISYILLHIHKLTVYN
jgi:hypothetical protein